MFSVIVPTYNRDRLLAATLDDLLAQKADVTYEIIVVDNNSTDGTSALIHGYAARPGEVVRYVFEGREGASATRNAGIGAARGETIAFVDDDVRVHPGWLQALADAYRAHPNAWGVGGRVILGLPERCPPWFDPGSRITEYLSRLDVGDETLQIHYPISMLGANMSVTREALSRVGLFNPDLGYAGSRRITNEDMEMSFRIYRAGGTLFYCGQAAVTHPVPAARLTKRWLRQRAYWEGRSVGLGTGYEHNERTAIKVIGRAALALRDSARALACYASGNSRRGVEHELAVWVRLGYLQQMLFGGPVRPAHRGKTLKAKELDQSAVPQHDEVMPRASAAGGGACSR